MPASVATPLLGGTCALRGCDSKKVLVSGEEAVDAVRRMRGHGIVGEAHIGRLPKLPRGIFVLFGGKFAIPMP